MDKQIDSDEAEGSASEWTIPNIEFVGVEHPFLVKNLDKAIDSLGGVKSVTKLVDRHKGRHPARLSLHPNDPLARTIESGVVSGNNVLLKIDVPKRTGRKRKRGTQDPFRTEDELAALGQHSKSLIQKDTLVKALHDNPENHKVSIVGQICRTHRFRDPPDFVWSHAPTGFISKFKNELLSGSLDQITRFRLNPDSTTHELLPAPTIAPNTTPWNYSYRQNVAVKTFQVNGRSFTFKTAALRQLKIPSINASEAEIPSPSEDELRASWRGLSKHDKELVRKIKALFDARPIWTRRGIRNMLRADGIHLVQVEHHVFAQLAYSFTSGPWRDCLVSYGVDPRKDPKMRIYQALGFRTDDMGRFGRKTRQGPREYTGNPPERDLSSIQPSASTPELAHIFDGTHLDTKGKMWQLCDITDPLIAKLHSTTNVRSTCSVEDTGWYHNGTWGKLRALTKAKMRHLVETGRPIEDGKSAAIQMLVKIPDHITQKSYARVTRMWDGMSVEEKKGVVSLRAVMRGMLSKERIGDLSPGREEEGERGVAMEVDEVVGRQLPEDEEEDGDAVDEETRDLIEDLEDDDEEEGEDEEDEDEGVGDGNNEEAANHEDKYDQMEEDDEPASTAA